MKTLIQTPDIISYSADGSTLLGCMPEADTDLTLSTTVNKII